MKLNGRGVMIALMLAAVAPLGAQALPEEGKIPTYSVPFMSKPPVIDGKIGAEEWREAAQITGVAPATGVTFYIRPTSFWVAWDEEHLYLAGRSWVNEGEKLLKQKREKYASGVVFDDAYEFGIGMQDRNRIAGEVSSFFKLVVNYLGCGEYLKMYPNIGQYLYNWTPEPEIGNGTTAEGRWWEQELAFDLKDLQMPVKNQAGDEVRLLLARDYKNPGWQQTNVPVNKGFMDQSGFNRAWLTRGQPYVQISRLEGLTEDKLLLAGRLLNPGAQAVRLRVSVEVRNEFRESYYKPDRSVLATPLKWESQVEVPAGGEALLRLERALEGMKYKPNFPGEFGVFELRVTDPGKPEAPAIYSSYFEFRQDPEAGQALVARPGEPFVFSSLFNPVRQLLWLEGDTLDADLPAGSKPAGLQWVVKQGEKEIGRGKLGQMVSWKYQGIAQLPTLAPGEYTVTGSLVDAAGKVLLSKTTSFAKKDEAKEFAVWWDNKLGNTERVLRPFTALKVKGGSVSPVLRTYKLSKLGLPAGISASGGEVLSGAARMIVTVGGKDYAVPLSGTPNFTEKRDWRVSFTGTSKAAGIAFEVQGAVEQDGFTEIDLTYAPEREDKPVAVQGLRIEWPVDDSLGNRMICIGMGGNYSCRKIGDIPPGKGVVWSTLDLGKVGSGMTLGNFYQEVWIGTEYRGLLWSAQSDEGWVPRDDSPAQEILREGKSVILRNNLIKVPAGQEPFRLEKARTVRFAFNATPFKPLEPGWRLSLRSAANGFGMPGYKVSRDGKLDGWAKLSPPSQDLSEWPGYYAEYKAEAEKRTRMGIYSVGPRVSPFLCNQLPLRGYETKTTEPGVYEYFWTEWMEGGESLASKSYADYLVYLQDRWVKEGGLRAVYYDISMIATMLGPWNGQGYVLPDGRLQPGGDNWNLRRYVMRVNAMMQENGLWPPGISGHATNSFTLCALPWYDAMLDAEFHMVDAIDTFPSDRMIAMGNSETFGMQVDQLGFMNPHWPMMHNGGMGGGHGCVYEAAEFRNWGIGQADVEFTGYWRNGKYVKEIAPGLIASLWRRPNTLLVGLMNYGPDAADKQQRREAELTLDLKALRIPEGLSRRQLRVRELQRSRTIEQRYVGELAWVKALPEVQIRPNEKGKVREEIEPQLDPRTGKLSGFSIGYHDQRYLVVSWEEQEAPATALADMAREVQPLALEWGLARARELPLAEVTRLVKLEEGSALVRAWVKPNGVLLRLANGTDKPMTTQMRLDLAGLGVQVTRDKLWQQFTQLYDLDLRGGISQGVWEELGKNRYAWGNPGTVAWDAWTGNLALTLGANEARYLCIDRD